ncbi:MAG: alanine dehydrogenase [Thermodesulfovibrio sp.]|nr:alanine dehydrogenase [Thermodesulfovibrio sp.]
MLIGVPKELKKEEYRVAITPAGVRELKRDGHTVLVEEGSGEGSGFPDAAYLEEGAEIVSSGLLYEKAELIIKVKEPLSSEFGLLRDGQALFTYLHLAPNKALTDLLLQKKITAIGYETVERHGGLPLLAPMSEIAGRMAPLVGSFYLQKIHGGTGVLASGVTGVEPARAVILGAGVVGSNAARICVGLGMDTTVMNRGMEKLQKIDDLFQGRVKTRPAERSFIEDILPHADLVIGAALVPGGKTPVLVSKDMLGLMKKGAVIVDVSVDQGGCIETSQPTTHDAPVYRIDGVIHYAVANMPGAYPRTSTLALTNATLPYIRILANKGIRTALSENAELISGLNTAQGKIIHPGLAASLGVTPGILE